MDDTTLLTTCLAVSGAFENGGGASYDTVAGNFDGNGMSVGILQWNAGQGTLQQLLVKISELMGWDKMQSFFVSSIQQLATSKPSAAIMFCIDHYLKAGSNQMDPVALAMWQKFLSQPESVNAQMTLAQQSVLAHAKSLVNTYTPAYADRTRPYAFFFDVVTQEGGMAVGHTVVPVITTVPTDVGAVLAYAMANDDKCATLWTNAQYTDPLAQLLLHYAYARSMMANPQYRWDTCSRRGTIACRVGIVHETNINLVQKID